MIFCLRDLPDETCGYIRHHVETTGRAPPGCSPIDRAPRRTPTAKPSPAGLASSGAGPEATPVPAVRSGPLARCHAHRDGCRDWDQALGLEEHGMVTAWR